MKFDRIPIGKFSLMTHLTQKALRLYDQKGLLVPEAKDAFSGYRCYSYPQIERGVKIRILSWMGFGLDEISSLLEAENQRDGEFIGGMMQKRYTETQLEIRRLQKIQNLLLNQTDTLELISMSVSEPITKEIPKMRVLSMRETGSYEVTIGKLIGELFGFVENSSGTGKTIKLTGPAMFLCHDKEYKENDADIEVSLPISGNLGLETPSITLKTLPAIKAVSVIHKGPYQEVDVAYSRIFEYMAENGMEQAGPSRALYLNDPNDVSEEELLTEVQVPIR
ncbi:MerR family transcriptional regulator [Methanococcoides methylutens]|uniref:MerR family transcriptional regulator n=1 Tax=Methanococcoides methylutens TaxID=2226 RepID=A0A099T4C2_METMT|nr:GyrI-like domain-containing protein [Methanococcoides methylutens]KGK99679.1 MerR family transcriptional regulator [Methanococcoides methylutens]